ncbi:MAG: polymer-forming cytoskeletal protein [Rhodoferax sp.]|uniref:bactofilin family protein n=1 Tax=Polynucleobacter sp. MG-Unter2-18 TaxID=2081052 RepID=UPI001BFD659D|nr:polymer-forming cytoskeletal protein [Polynucleobacter sp. MG-Unter2-18]MCF8165248.1 polymer-forming cytoskeletal protein [Rhodoferax sp.]QWD95025.1 polymer-forming cytoskeletal protein [Polynucleobacter sp. MG-Unter2-18]
MKQNTVIRLLDPSKETFGSIIGSDLEIIGSLLATKSLRIDGTIVGDIKTKAGADVCIALGKTGLVQGNISGVRVLVAGRVEGNVLATERVELHSGADVHGDIIYAQIGIEQGARLSGLLSKIINDDDN